MTCSELVHGRTLFFQLQIATEESSSQKGDEKIDRRGITKVKNSEDVNLLFSLLRKVCDNMGLKPKFKGYPKLPSWRQLGVKDEECSELSSVCLGLLLKNGKVFRFPLLRCMIKGYPGLCVGNWHGVQRTDRI
jgi:hypothetical protein